MSNTDVSRLLGEMWRNASPRERAPYVEQEKRERAIYKKDIAMFRADQAKQDAASRTSHESVKRMGDVMQRGFEEYRPEQIAPVASNDSHSLHEFRVPHFDPYAGSQYSSRGHPPVGTGKLWVHGRESVLRPSSNTGLCLVLCPYKSLSPSLTESLRSLAEGLMMQCSRTRSHCPRHMTSTIMHSVGPGISPTTPGTMLVIRERRVHSSWAVVYFITC